MKKTYEQLQESLKVSRLGNICLIVVVVILIVAVVAQAYQPDEQAQFAIEVEDFSLEEVDISRVKNNDTEYTAMMIADAENNLAIWMLKDTLRDNQEEISAVEMTIKYLESIYDALPQDADLMDRSFIETILDGNKDHLEELKKDYAKNLELLGMMEDMRNSIQEFKDLH